jgi:hypothetical protein
LADLTGIAQSQSARAQENAALVAPLLEKCYRAGTKPTSANIP